ncbi:MAG: hypothetical protein M1832_005001 [Thelocarpon impressellum]|nr:MAG: hypothetical protein M1832_005001 [Thelocarpon impressellum]
MQPTRQSPPFPFLRLPPQLRARVYTLLLTAPCPVTPVLLQQTTSYVTHYTPHGAPRWQPLDPLPRVPHSALAVAGTSRAVLAEALPAFYAANAFAFKSTPHLHAFLAALSPARLALLCSLHVALRGFRGRSARVCRVLGAACPGLRRLSVSVEGGGTADARAMLDALAESVRGLEVLDVGWRGRGVPGGGWPAFVEAVARQVTAPRIVVVPPSPSSAPAALPRPMRGVPEPAGVAREEGSWDTITWVYEADEMWRLRRV